MHNIQRTAPLIDLVKDETVYSILAKFCKLAGFPSTNETLKHLDLTLHYQLDSDLPGFIPTIAKMAGISGKDVLDNHCIINYFKPFSKKEVFCAAEASLLEGRSSDIHAKLSLISNRTGKHEKLLYCLSCVKESIDKFGISYWNREHQLPGVSICLVHHMELSSIDRCRKNTTLPNEMTDHKSDANIKKCTLKETLLASLSSSLLLGKVPGYLDQSKVILTYRLRLRDLGFTTKKMHIRQKRLRRKLMEFWDDVISNTAVAAVFSDKVEHPFPQNMFYGTGTHHPLKHLLLIGFLFNDLADFCLAYERAEYWIEENTRICDVKASEIKAKIIRNERTIILLRDGRSLRQVAQMTGASVGYVKKVALSNKIIVKARPKKIYKTEIRAIWRKLYTGESTAKIAKQFSISVAAVEHILSAHPYLPELRAKIRFFTTRKIHREKIELYIAENPTATRNQIKLELGATYSWLFKNDKIWLYENLPLRIITPSKIQPKLVVPTQAVVLYT
jgi:transposase